jgi:RNA polymerase sigma factor (sigma-70 family)
MAENPVARLIPEFARYRLEGAADGDLLDRYVRSRDEAAFSELVRRHGGMVLGVCRRVLRNSADADDAFQAAFLVLAKRAAAIQPASAVGAWLHGVAFRCSREALKRAARRHKYESRVSPREPDPEPMPHDIRPILDAELDRLPRAFAEVLVLCDMEDRPRREVAALLGVPEGTIASRLSRARNMLAERLSRRGLGVTAGVLATAMTADAQVMTAGLVAETTRAALGAASESVSGLAKGVMGGLTKRMKLGFACVILAGLATGGWAATQDWSPPVPPAVPPVQPIVPPHVVAEAPPPVDPLERARGRLIGAWRVQSGTRDGQPLTPWEKQGLGLDLDANGNASLNRLLLQEQRAFSWRIENATTLLLEPKQKNLTAVRLPFEVNDETLIVSITEPGSRGGPRSPYGGSSYRLMLARTSALRTVSVAVSSSPQNVVARGIVGTWEWDADLNAKLGNTSTGRPTLTVTRDDSVADAVPANFRELFEGKRVYLAGRVVLSTRNAKPVSHRFLLIEHLGNPLLVYFVPKPGDDWHCEEAVTVGLAAGAKPEQDLLFLTSFEGAKGLPAGGFKRVK